MKFIIDHGDDDGDDSDVHGHHDDDNGEDNDKGDDDRNDHDDDDDRGAWHSETERAPRRHC